MVIIGAMVKFPTHPSLKRMSARIGVLCAAAIVLSSCYLPVRFDTEIELNRAGYYSLTFDGYLADVGLYKGLREGKISPAEEKKKAAVIERDFRRDVNTQEFSYIREGHFKLNWKRSGDLLKAKTVTFIRRNELILQLKYMAKSGYIVLEGKSIAKQNRALLQRLGLNMQGQIRVKTDLPIKSDNATFKKKDPKDPRFTWLVWDVKSIMSPRPRAIFIIE